VGTSAGSLVAAALVAGHRPRRPRGSYGRRELGSGAPAGAGVAADATSKVLSPGLPSPRSLLLIVACAAARLAGVAATPLAPVTIDGREYVDGGVWSNTNLDVAPAARLTQVLCLNPIASLDIAIASPFGLLRAIAGSTAALETLALRSRGAKVRMVGPSPQI